MKKNNIGNLNLLALKIFSSLILTVGGLTFFIPELIIFLSSTPSYNLFRVNLGLTGIIIALTDNYTLIKYFNFVVGLLYVYQVIASMLHLFPIEYFHWSIADTIVNTDLGLSFLLISLLGMIKE